MRRFDFILLNVICFVSLVFLLTTLSVSFIKKQENINNIMYQEILKISNEKKKLSLEEKKDKFKISLIYQVIQDIIFIYKNNDNLDIIPFMIQEKYPYFSTEVNAKLSKEYFDLYNKIRKNNVIFLLSLFSIIIINYAIFIYRLYNYYGRQRLFISSIIYIIPFSNLYYMIRKGKDKNLNLKIIEIERLKEKIDFEKIENKYLLLMSENKIKINGFLNNLTKFFASIPIIKWIKILRNIFKFMSYISVGLLIISIIGLLIIESHYFVSLIVISIILIIIFNITIYGVDKLQYDKILTFNTKEEMVEEAKYKEVLPRLKLRTNIFKTKEG